MSGNAAASYGGAYYGGVFADLAISNSLIWGNYAGTDGDQFFNEGTATFSYTGIEDGTFGIPGGGTNNSTFETNLSATDDIFGSPIRATGANTPNVSGNYHLSKFSVAINGGNASLLPTDTLDIDGDNNTVETLPLDIDLNTRVLEKQVDLGADESKRCNGMSFPQTVSTADALRLAIHCANGNNINDVINLSTNITLTNRHDNGNFGEGNGLPDVSSVIRINEKWVRHSARQRGNLPHYLGTNGRSTNPQQYPPQQWLCSRGYRRSY